jgi:hypothetical protein
VIIVVVVDYLSSQEKCEVRGKRGEVRGKSSREARDMSSVYFFLFLENKKKQKRAHLAKELCRLCVSWSLTKPNN